VNHEHGMPSKGRAEHFENLSCIHAVRDDKEVRTNRINTRKVTKLRDKLHVGTGGKAMSTELLKADGRS
jgi:hypothetical protein